MTTPTTAVERFRAKDREVKVFSNKINDNLLLVRPRREDLAKVDRLRWRCYLGSFWINYILMEAFHQEMTTMEIDKKILLKNLDTPDLGYFIWGDK